MPVPAPIPETFLHRPFTRAEAHAAGLTDRHLRGARFRLLFRGVYAATALPMTFRLWTVAALMVSPKDGVVSHATALRLWGLDLPGFHRLHVSTNAATRTRIPGVRTHRRKAQISRRDVDGVPVTGPERTFVDLCPSLPFVWRVVVADYLVAQGLTTRDRLDEYAWDRHLDGVQRARRTMRWVRDRVESPMESVLRLMVVLARLPEPECNVEIFDGSGAFVARVDLAIQQYRVAVEYDGAWHARSAHQRTRDRDRRERLERLGWTVVVVIDRDLRVPAMVPRRVTSALRDHGYVGPDPRLSMMWNHWFSPRTMWSLGDHAGAPPWYSTDHFS